MDMKWSILWLEIEQKNKLYVRREMDQTKSLSGTRNTGILLIQTCVRIELDVKYLISGLKKRSTKIYFLEGCVMDLCQTWNVKNKD